MSTPHEPVAGQVVQLLERWGAPLPSPRLPVKPSLSVTARVLLTIVVVAVTAVGVFLIIQLWVQPTPGWWFSLLFTVMITLFVVGAMTGLLSAVHDGRLRDRAARRWAAEHAAATATGGVIVARAVDTYETGTVGRFTLSVRTDGGETLSGVWRPPSPASLLQPQVPGIGTAVRVWRLPGGDTHAPLIIEVRDPTVVDPEEPGASAPQRGEWRTP